VAEEACWKSTTSTYPPLTLTQLAGESAGTSLVAFLSPSSESLPSKPSRCLGDGVLRPAIRHQGPSLSLIANLCAWPVSVTSTPCTLPRIGATQGVLGLVPRQR